MKVLHSTLDLGAAGSQRQIRNLASGSRAGRHTHAVHTMRSGGFIDDLVSNGVSVYVANASKWKPWRAITSLASAIHEFKPDILQPWLPHTEVICGIVGAVYRLPVIGNERNSRLLYTQVQNVKSAWYAPIRPIILRHFVVSAIANSQAGAEYLRDDLRVKVPIHVIPNGVDLAAIDGQLPLSRSELNFDTETPLLVAASRLVPHKRLDLKIEGIARLKSAGTRVNLMVCGEGPELQNLQQLAENLGVADQVRLAGLVKNIIPVLKAADYFCTASEVEGLPNSLLEALSCSLPSIVSDIPEHREVLGDSIAGKYFARGSVEGFVTAVQSQLSARETDCQRRNAAREIANGYSIEAMCSAFDSFYSSFEAHHGKRERS